MLEFLMNTTFLFEILLLLAPEIHLGSLYLPAILQCLQKGYSTSFSKMCIVLFFPPQRVLSGDDVPYYLQAQKN